jgi:hypothetical protein
MVHYTTADLYIESKTKLLDKITAIDAIISALETVALKAAATGNVQEYSLDDGQTKIKTMYRSPAEVEASITAFERIKQRYINEYNGPMVRLVDGKNFKNRRNGRC